jgi:hypothetical protein
LVKRSRNTLWLLSEIGGTHRCIKEKQSQSVQNLIIKVYTHVSFQRL